MISPLRSLAADWRSGCVGSPSRAWIGGAPLRLGCGSAGASPMPGVCLLARIRAAAVVGGGLTVVDPASIRAAASVPRVVMSSRPSRSGRAADNDEEHLVDKQVRIKVGKLDCRSSDGGARGCRNLVEGVGDAVHSSTKVTPGETLEPFRIVLQNPITPGVG